jgi:acyl-CoA reductase-like NAD-dependent aldehyde dehydrogenase
VHAGGAPAIIVHSQAQAVAALRAAAAAATPIVLLSAPEAGVYAGPGWFAALVAAAREAVPEAQFSALLDCGDSAGAALAGLRRGGVERILFTGRADVAERLADIGRQLGIAVATERPEAALDLLELILAPIELIERHCAESLARNRRF